VDPGFSRDVRAKARTHRFFWGGKIGADYFPFCHDEMRFPIILQPMSPRRAARNFDRSKGDNMSSNSKRKSLFLRLITITTLALLCLNAWAVAKSGKFPDWISMPGVSARGVAVDKIGNVYVSASVPVLVNDSPAELIRVRKFSPDGKELFFMDIGYGTIGGLTVSSDGDLYIAVAAGSGRGVYRMDPEGEDLELLPGSEDIFFANGLAFDDVGNLYITESVSLNPGPSGPGGIWRIRRGGRAELCLRDPLLDGTGSLPLVPPMGANGIAYYHGNLYVINTEQSSVVRIPLGPDGSVGIPELWTTLVDVPEYRKYLDALKLYPQAYFPPMGDGLALDVFGNLYVVVLTQSAIVRINLSEKSQETVAVFADSNTEPLYAPLDVPASIFFGTGKGERTSIFVTNQGIGKSIVPPLPWAGPGLVKIDAGVPGRPLH
jgi:sugar lactone lactonase YvrE